PPSPRASNTNPIVDCRFMERTPQKRFLLSPLAEVKIYSPVPRVNRQRQRASAAPAKGSFLYTKDLKRSQTASPGCGSLLRSRTTARAVDSSTREPPIGVPSFAENRFRGRQGGQRTEQRVPTAGDWILVSALPSLL